MVVSTKFVCFSDISAVKCMAGWCLFATKTNRSISSLVVSHRENTSLIYLFHSRGFILLLLIVSVPTAESDIKIWQKILLLFSHCETMSLEFLPLKWKEFSCSISRSKPLSELVGMLCIQCLFLLEIFF